MGNISEEEKFFITELLKENIELLKENYTFDKTQYENFIMDRMINKMSEEILKLDRIRASHEYDKPRIWETEKGIKEYFRKKVE